VSSKISICSPAKNPHLWERLYASALGSSIPFEVIFVGPNPPLFKLPPNMRFIHSNVKPSQCYEIAVRESTGDLLIHMADDCEFITPQALDILYDVFTSKNDYRAVISCRFMLNGVDQSHFAHKLKIGPTWFPDSVIMPCFPIMSRRFYEELGGIDQQFLAVCFDMDLAMRIYEAGSCLTLCGVYGSETKPIGCTTFEDRVWLHDRELFDSLWSLPGAKIQMVRTRPLDPFPSPISHTKSHGATAPSWS